MRQTEMVLALLRQAHPGAVFETKTVRTAGDRSRASLSEIGGRGVFVIELEKALLERSIDIAVHSLKDLPSAETPGLKIAGVGRREEPHDALISRDGLKLVDLPPGAIIGTGSPRRAAQILSLRPDLRVKDIRGNVDTRLRKVQDGEYDAVILARAGMARLGWLERVSEVFSTERMLPAAGQGALAIETRADDAEAIELVAVLEDRATRASVTAERAFEMRLGGGCHSAIAALGELSGDRLRLRGLVGDTAGKRLLREEVEGSPEEAEGLGIALADRLIARGAADLLEAQVR